MLPGALSAALLLTMASSTSHWDLHTKLGLGVFGLLLVASSLFLSVALDRLTFERRRRSSERRLLNRTGPRSRLVKFVLGGLVVPIAALAAASQMELPNHQTLMTLAALAIRSQLAKPEDKRAALLADAVLRAQSPSAKVQGILALQAMGSTEALDQLLRILGGDPSALKNVGEYQVLCAALASYGVQSKMKLLQGFNGVPASARRNAPGPAADPFGRESDVSSLEPTASESERPPTVRAELPSFIMQTFLQTSLKVDGDLLAFARQTAGDDGWSEAVRGQALELIAKLGGKEDLDGLYTYLESPSPLLQAHALRAIAALQSKLSGPATKG